MVDDPSQLLTNGDDLSHHCTDGLEYNQVNMVTSIMVVIVRVITCGLM